MTLSTKILLVVAILATCVTTAIYTAAAQEPTAPTLPGDASPATAETPAVAPAADAAAGPRPNWVDNEPTPAELAQANPLGTLAQIVSEIRAGDYREAVGLAMLLIVGLLIRFGRKWWTWFSTDEGGTVFAFGTAFLVTGGISLVGEAPIDFTMARVAFGAGMLAIGGYSVIWMRSIRPRLERRGWLKAKTSATADG